MKKYINKIIDIGYKFLLIFTIICLIISLIGAIFGYVNRSYNYFNPLVLILGSILYLFGICKLYNFIVKLSERKKKIVCGILLLFHFILLLISSLMINSIPKVDLIHILIGINSLNDKGIIINNNYFSVYPNNRFIFVILYNLQKISPSNSKIIFSIVSSLGIMIMSLFTCKTVEKMWDINKGLLSLFICVFSPIFYLYVSYYYTDILMLPFASILIYLMVISIKCKRWKNNIALGFIIGFIAVISYKIRAVSIFLLIAYFIYIFISNKFIDAIKIFLIIIISFVVTLLGINKIIDNYFIDVDVNKEFPITHWIMMGLNEESNGYYSQEDYKISSAVPNVNERIDVNVREIKNRVNNLGIFGLVKLLILKLVTVWGKGDYSYQKYLDLVSNYNGLYKYLILDKNIVINYLLQFSKIVILGLVISSLIKMVSSKKKSFMAIALFGAVIFYLIWEVCPRYGLSFLPWLIIISSYSYGNLNNYVNKFMSYKFCKYIILGITIILLVLGLEVYTNIKYHSDVVLKDTSGKMKYVTIDEDNSLVQSFIVNNKFNEIKLFFRNNYENISDIFKLEIMNEFGDNVYVRYFSSKDVQDNEYTIFRFDKDYKKGKYYIKLSAYDNSKIEVCLVRKDYYDFYPDGNLKINDILTDGDLMFEIVDNNMRGIYSYFEYILIIGLVIYLEYILLFRKNKKEFKINKNII